MPCIGWNVILKWSSCRNIGRDERVLERETKKVDRKAFLAFLEKWTSSPVTPTCSVRVGNQLHQNKSSRSINLENSGSFKRTIGASFRGFLHYFVVQDSENQKSHRLVLFYSILNYLFTLILLDYRNSVLVWM